MHVILGKVFFIPGCVADFESTFHQKYSHNIAFSSRTDIAAYSWFLVSKYRFDLQVCLSVPKLNRYSSDEIANVNFLYDDIIHALQNTGA